MTTPAPDQLAEAAVRATPEDDSLDDLRALSRAAQESGQAVHDLEALASSEAVQAIIDLRLEQERERASESLRRLVGLAIVVASSVGLAAGAVLALLLWPG